MSRAAPLLSALALCILQLTWGPCPGTLARAVVSFGAPRAARPGCCDCGCRDGGRAPKPERSGVPKDPAGKDCPYCSRTGGRPEMVLAEDVPEPQAPQIAPGAPPVRALAIGAASLEDEPLPEILRPPRDGPTGSTVFRI